MLTHDPDAEDAPLDAIRQAVLTLADRQTATLQAVAAQGVRLDALAAAVRGVEHQVATSNGLLAEVAAALDTKSESTGDMRALADAVLQMAGDVRELREGTGAIADAVSLLAERLDPSAD